ncbi:saccharopine dehydrogenase family protein [Rhodococcoides corynebacterioides]|uniref:Saccharopine dehydrogenase NADP-binding domain-containing protein n=1 Tax=Rhodococcoides corynebacterioides TaxID=53972 RepID=A0ABS7P183_9NOCA|nr:saccharopine dehydrogenase NADP-binding domain-containing protein [Rhodococcus corynebacterioides]MBY6366160.1 saccharopine dehydrogenase NADP-binding domain-containing protein [Rhodococcus corynebacterioides]MBY6406882.1 saccharopine dehydrogenase NADP-binding domain-containing protein [Rhodococcus corynebacterioides]
MADSTRESTAREFEIVVYGATGFVGALTAEYLARHAPDGTTVALAGRSREKLESTRRGLPARAADWPLVVADADDEAALTALAQRTSVVLTTVGPYAKYGRVLARVCAESGTDYVDLTGEVLFARASADENHETAVRTGARIVHSCGFDSVPSDIGVFELHRKVTEDGAGDLTDTTLVVTSMSGGVSGGTIDSLRGQIDEITKDRAAAKLAASPYSLSPDRSVEPDFGRQNDAPVLKGSSIHPSLKGWKAPFVMASYNTRVVRRTNAILGYPYGKTFKYNEVMSVGSSPASPVLAAGVLAGLGAFVAGLAFKPTRFLLDKVLPAPGSGPSEKTRQKGHFVVDIYTTTTSGEHYVSRVKAKGDPGYAATAMMLGESALALVKNRDELPSLGGGVLTPASGIGTALITRLRAAGMEISARKV